MGAAHVEQRRLSEINGERILFNRSSSFVLKRQMEEIRKVYQRLKVLVILATVVLTLVVGSGVVRSSTGMFNALISLR
jgi:nucleoside permease NupC